MQQPDVLALRKAMPCQTDGLLVQWTALLEADRRDSAASAHLQTHLGIQIVGRDLVAAVHGKEAVVRTD